MKTMIIGSRDCSSIDILKEAITQAQDAGISITSVITGEEKGVSKLAAEWAEENCINIATYPVDWNDISVENAVIKERFDQYKKRKQMYNSAAGKQRDQEMLSNCEAVISIDMNTGHSKWTALSAQKMGLKVYEYTPMPMEDDLEEIIF